MLRIVYKPAVLTIVFIGLVVPASREEIWGSGNFAMHGLCGAMRSALMGGCGAKRVLFGTNRN